MLKNTLVAALLAAAIGAGSLVPAEAASLGGPLPKAATQNAVTPAAYVVHKRLHHRFVHGLRFRHRHGRYLHFYRGYWYATPWWRHHRVVAVRIAPHRRHVAWCAAHHPSYNPKTNTWIGRHGILHRCGARFA